MTDRYEVQSALRKPNGDWYGVVGAAPDPDELWFFIRDTAEDAADWDDAEIAPGPFQSEVRATCDLLNRLWGAVDPKKLCNHSHYSFDKHGRVCTCGVFMADFGD